MIHSSDTDISIRPNMRRGRKYLETHTVTGDVFGLLRRMYCLIMIPTGNGSIIRHRAFGCRTIRLIGIVPVAGRALSGHGPYMMTSNSFMSLRDH